jgi:hypothetical protein
MGAPKSDTATMVARRSRLLELLLEGKTEVEAAQILEDEGYPASIVTIRRDVKSLAPAWREANLDAYSEHAQRQFQELRDLKIALTDVGVSPKERIVLALQILDREMDLLGTKAPTKSIQAHVSGPKLDSLYLDIRDILLDADEETKRAALALVREFVQSRKKSSAALILEGDNNANLS